VCRYVGQSDTLDLQSCIFVLRSLQESEGKYFKDLLARQRSGSSPKAEKSNANRTRGWSEPTIVNVRAEIIAEVGGKVLRRLTGAVAQRVVAIS
jgi:hypothetical protein